MSQSSFPQNYTRIRKRRPGPPRRGPANIPAEEWRNEKYRAFLREKGQCVACHYSKGRLVAKSTEGACDPAHGPVNGTSSKGPDSGCIPLCRGHHSEQHAIRWPVFERKYGFDRERESVAWWNAFKIMRNML